MSTVVTNVNLAIFYILLPFGIYGRFFTEFVPTETTSFAGNATAAILTIFLCATFILSVLRNKGRSRLALKGYKFYFFTYLGVPLMSAALWLFYSPALTHGFPSPITSVIGLTEERTVTVLKSLAWGKNDNQFVLWLSGFPEGVRVSKKIYDKFPPNTKTKITIKTSNLGSKILNFAHAEI